MRGSPSAKAEATGKKMAMVAMTIFEARPKPNQSASSGAIAKTGIAWLTTITGRSRRLVIGRKLMASASTAPSRVPATRPIRRLGQRRDGVDRQRSGRSRSASKTASGAGSMNGGGAKTRMIACQMTSRPSATPSARTDQHRTAGLCQ